MENNHKTQPQSQGKIIIEVQPKGGVNLNKGNPYDECISIQLKAVLSESDRVMILHALAVSLSNGNNTEALSLLNTALRFVLHTCLTGNSWCEQTSGGTLIDNRVLEALRNNNKKKGRTITNDLCILGYLGSNYCSPNMDNNIRMGSVLHSQTLCGISLHHKAQKGIEVIPLCTPVL